MDGTAGRTLDLPEHVGPLYWSAGWPIQRVRSGRVEFRVAPTPTRHPASRRPNAAPAGDRSSHELTVYGGE